MLDKTKRYLVVGLGLLGGKYALELTRAGFHVDGINRSEGHLQYALEHGYIAGGKTHDFEDLVRQADHIIFGLYPTALLDWFGTYGHLLKPGCIFTDVSGVKTGLVEPVQALCPAGVEFIASHPMAGRETSSVEHAAEVNFAPANFIITPTEKNTPAGIRWARELAEVLGFKHICTLTVQDGAATAAIVWSSSKYDYMLVNGERYDVLSTEPGSTFEIPVEAFDTDLTVIGDTTAMSTPHEIEYTLTFKSATAVEAAQ